MKICFIYGSLLCILSSGAAWADPGDAILTTYSENGLHQFDFRIGNYEQRDQPDANSGSIGLGMGLTDNWFSELYVGYAKAGSDVIHLDSVSIQITFLLTGSDSAVDVGLYTEVEYENDRSAGEKIVFGPLLQTEFGLTKLNLNLLFHRNYYSDFSNPLVMDYQWQVKRHWNQPVDFGMQGFGEFGQWNHWAPKEEQAHRIGPALFGKLDVGEKQVINYNAAILFDVFNAIHGTTLRLQVVYGF